MTSVQNLQIDVVIDTMCPWCYIGKRRLEKALELHGDIELDLRWRPFQLDPAIPPEGEQRHVYLERKYGRSGTAPARRRPVEHAGAREGLAFNFWRIEIAPNTLASHLLVRWSATAGRQNEMVEHLFALYLIEGENIGDRDVLIAAAARVGLDAELIAGLLDRGADRDLIGRDIALARKIGIEGVPCFIFDNTYILQGAQDPEIIADAIGKCLGAQADN